MGGDHFFSLILATGPEEAAQAVFAFARNDVDVKVRNALADDVVDCDEAAFRLHGLLHFASELLGIDEKRTYQIGREIEQCWVVGFGNQQDMAGEKRAHVEKGHGDLVFENNFGFDFVGDNFAERAGLVYWRVLLLRLGVRARFFHMDKINLTQRLAYRKFPTRNNAGVNLIHGVNWFGDFA